MTTPAPVTFLVVPGSSERMLEKARGIAVDEVVIDLEDAVVAERKADARAAAVAALAAGGFSARAVSVRINAPGTPWAHDDLIALGGAPRRPDSVVVPKVESADDLAFVERAVGDARRLPVQALVETARGLRALYEIATAASTTEALVLGYADLAASLGRSRAAAANLDLWLAVQDAFLTAARAAGLRAIDGPFLAIDDEDGLRAAAERAADLGFDGKWAIHPSQIETVATAFAPSPDEIAHAEAVLAALAQAGNGTRGAVALDGSMVDEPVRLAALRTLARAGRTVEPSP